MIALLIVLGAISAAATLYIVADFCAYTIALKRCAARGETEIWFAQPNRLRIGSGFRLLKLFPNP